MKRLVVLGILFSAGALSISAAAWQAPPGGGQPAPRVVTAEKLRDNLYMMGGAGGGMTGGFTGGADTSRYRIEFYASAQNLTNRRNYIGYSGVLTSPFFGQPTNVLNPRKVEVGVRFGF